MRPIFTAFSAALTLSAGLILTSGPVAALGLMYDFPTLTWPVTTPAPSVDQPHMQCTNAVTGVPVICPTPSR